MRCPFCGADENKGALVLTRGLPFKTIFLCGTVLWDVGNRRAGQVAACVSDEVGRLNARIAALESSSHALLDVIDGDAEDITEAVDALREVMEAKP